MTECPKPSDHEAISRLNELIDLIRPLPSVYIERLFSYGSPSVFIQIFQGFVIDGNREYLPEELKK